MNSTSSSSYFWTSPREVANEMVSTVTSWTSSAFGHCFSRIRRVQFDEEHKRSLLSCHSTEQEEASFLSDQAMLELRRRVQLVEQDSKIRRNHQHHHHHPHDDFYQKPSHNIPSNNKKITKKTRREKKRSHHHHHHLGNGRRAKEEEQQEEEQEDDDDANEEEEEEPQEFQMIISDAEQTLKEILGKKYKQKNLHPYQTHSARKKKKTTAKEDETSSMSIDELLSLDIETLGEEEEDNQKENDPANTSLSVPEASQKKQVKELQAWLLTIDPTRPVEYEKYLDNFLQQGFQSVQDLSELDEDDVEQAMSEIGIAKFAHRARIRKAILRLHQSNQMDA